MNRLKYNQSNFDQKPFKVGIVGSYGGLNLGDEAILHSIVAQLKKSLPVEITVFSRNPQDTLQRHQINHAVAVRDLSKNEVLPEIQRLDVLVLGGGGILFDAEAKIFLREVDLAHESGIPVMVYGIGAGPLEESVTQMAVRRALNQAMVITVREREARQVLEQAGITQEILITADPALLLEPQPLPYPIQELQNLPKRRLVGFSVREPGSAAPDLDINHYHQLLADAADYIADRYRADILFIPMERQQQDLQHSHAVISHMLFASHATVLKEQLGAAQLLEAMKYLDFAVGMRLHFLIFSALQNVPFVALPYASKVNGFLDLLEIKAPPIHLVSAGRLLAYIDEALDSSEILKEKMKNKIPQIQALARKNNEILVELLQCKRAHRDFNKEIFL